MRRQMQGFLAVIAFSTLLVSRVDAAYVLAPRVSGLNSVTVNEGQTIAVDFILSRNNTTDFNTSATYTVEFSKPGLRYISYAWASPYLTGALDDKSKPSPLPATLTAASYVASFGDPGAVDVYFENFAASGSFTTGSITTLNLTIPSGFGAGPVTITAVPDTFDDGNASIFTTGGFLTVNVQVPEPGSTLWAACLGYVIVARRHRRPNAAKVLLSSDSAKKSFNFR